MSRIYTLSDLITMCQRRCDMENSDLVSSAEWKALISSQIATLHSELNLVGVRLFETYQTISTVAATYATGSITHVTKAELVDGETFTIHDGYGPLTFEFDVGGTGVLVEGNVRINVSADTTAEEVETRTNTAINAATHVDGTAFKITASSGGTGISTLTNDASGSVGNQLSSEDVADADFVITNMTGGGGSYILPKDYLSTVRVDYVVSSTTGERRPLYELTAQENHVYSASGAGEATAYELIDGFLHLWPVPPVSQSYRHTYIRQPVKLDSATTSAKVDVISPDGEEFILWGVAVKALAKEESEVGLHRAERDEALARVIRWAVNRNLNNSRRVPDPEDVGGFDPSERWHYSR